MSTPGRLVLVFIAFLAALVFIRPAARGREKRAQRKAVSR